MPEAPRIHPDGPASTTRKAPLHYELWAIDSGNLMGCYASIEEALVVVRAFVDAFGADYVNELLIGTEDADAESALVATGEGLAKLLASPE